MDATHVKDQYAIDIYQHIIVTGKPENNGISILQCPAAGLHELRLKGHTDIIIRSFR